LTTIRGLLPDAATDKVREAATAADNKIFMMSVPSLILVTSESNATLVEEPLALAYSRRKVTNQLGESGKYYNAPRQ
jgi:hypothetical protein